MIKIVFGDDRLQAERIIKRELGNSYEVFEGENLDANDMPSLFLGVSLFGDKRKVLVKNLSDNKDCFVLLSKYVNTEHLVILWEEKFDKRTSAYKELKKLGVELIECKMMEPTNSREVFDVFDTMLRDGKRAVKMIERMEKDQDAYMFFGLLVTQAIKKYEMRQGIKEKRVLKELSKTDILMKTSGADPWTLIKMLAIKLSLL